MAYIKVMTKVGCSLLKGEWDYTKSQGPGQRRVSKVVPPLQIEPHTQKLWLMSGY